MKVRSSFVSNSSSSSFIIHDESVFDIKKRVYEIFSKYVSNDVKDKKEIFELYFKFLDYFPKMSKKEKKELLKEFHSYTFAYDYNIPDENNHYVMLILLEGLHHYIDDISWDEVNSMWNGGYDEFLEELEREFNTKEYRCT